MSKGVYFSKVARLYIREAEFIRAGAVALGVGSSLVNQKLFEAGDMAELTRRAAAFIEEVKKGRALASS